MKTGPRLAFPFILTRSFSILVLTFLARLAVPSLQAQTADAVLTKVKAVLALPDAMAESGARIVKLHGKIVEVSARGDECALHDGESCISLMLVNGTVTPGVGAEVEVEGNTISEPFFERKRTRVKVSKITALGIASLPVAKPVGPGEVSEFKHLDQWVSVEGTVLQVRASMTLFTIQLASGSASCNIVVRNWPRDFIPRDWIGGRVRVVGVNRPYLPGSSFLSVVSPSQAQVTVLKTGVIDALDAPKTTVSAVLNNPISGYSGRVKLTGTLMAATSGNVYYARAEDGSGFSFYMLLPIDEDKSGRFSTPIIQPKCQPGDALEVVGIPRITESSVHLNFGVVRVLHSGSVPEPALSDIASINAGKHVHDLVEVQGRLLLMDEVLVAPGRWRTTLKLQDAEHSIIAYLDSTSRGALTHIERDHQLLVQGIVTGAPHFPETRIWVTSRDGVKSLGIASDLVTRRLWTGLVIAAVIMTMLTGWALMQRRSRKVVDELNASLEQRVAERTAELGAAKDDLALALSKERELSELKTRFVSLVSHEFRTPLGIIMSAVEVLRHFGNRITPEKHEEMYGDIHSATLQMSGLMEQVLLLGRAEANKLGWRPAALDLPELCAKLLDEARSVTHGRCPINFIAEGEFGNVLMDESLLRHIIGNLVSNAVKYSAEGSPVELKVSRQGDETVFTVKDHGIGIPKADQPRLFEAFHRASNVGETPGTGLGLLLVKHCVDLHHGTINVESNAGEGTTFTVRLPVQTVQ